MRRKYMTISTEHLYHLSSLAYLNAAPALTKDLSAIIHFVEHLCQIDTTGIQPLTHPMDAIQTLRSDQAEACNLSETLGRIAPQFKDNLYLVPKVIQS